MLCDDYNKDKQYCIKQYNTWINELSGPQDMFPFVVAILFLIKLCCGAQRDVLRNFCVILWWEKDYEVVWQI